MSLIPEPVDYFMHCTKTQDCKSRCLSEYSAFEESKLSLQTAGVTLGFNERISVPIQSALFDLRDVDNTDNDPPFKILDMLELPPAACMSVCSNNFNTELQRRCLLLAGLRQAKQTDVVVSLELAVAYYCLPLDIREYAHEWMDMQVSSLPAADEPNAYPSMHALVLSVHIATSYKSQFTQRDSLLVLTKRADTSARASGIAPDAVVYEISLTVPNYPRKVIFRSRTHAERDLNTEYGNTALHLGYLHTVDQVFVTPAYDV